MTSPIISDVSGRGVGLDVVRVDLADLAAAQARLGREPDHQLIALVGREPVDPQHADQGVDGVGVALGVLIDRAAAEGLDDAVVGEVGLEAVQRWPGCPEPE